MPNDMHRHGSLNLHGGLSREKMGAMAVLVGIAVSKYEQVKLA